MCARHMLEIIQSVHIRILTLMDLTLMEKMEKTSMYYKLW